MTEFSVPAPATVESKRESKEKLATRSIAYTLHAPVLLGAFMVDDSGPKFALMAVAIAILLGTPSLIRKQLLRVSRSAVSKLFFVTEAAIPVAIFVIALADAPHTNGITIFWTLVFLLASVVSVFTVAKFRRAEWEPR